MFGIVIRRGVAFKMAHMNRRRVHCLHIDYYFVCKLFWECERERERETSVAIMYHKINYTLARAHTHAVWKFFWVFSVASLSLCVCLLFSITQCGPSGAQAFEIKSTYPTLT